MQLYHSGSGVRFRPAQDSCHNTQTLTYRHVVTAAIFPVTNKYNNIFLLMYKVSMFSYLSLIGHILIRNFLIHDVIKGQLN